jgi:hypothetical protein
MSVTVTVALITSISTLLGGLIASLIGLGVQRQQIAAQAALATSEREEQRLQKAADTRRQTYVQFLNHVNDVERLLDKNWRNRVPDDPNAYAGNAIRETWETAQDLDRAANMVALEGPTEVAEIAKTLYWKMFEEILVITKANTSAFGSGKEAMDAAGERYNECLRVRRLAKHGFISAARKVIGVNTITESADLAVDQKLGGCSPVEKIV